MIARGLFRREGISAPEHIGRITGWEKFMLDGLRERGVLSRETVRLTK
jgi:hypothetical protein